MHQARKYYEHSGAITPVGLILMLVFGAVGALVLGGIYGYAIFYIPLIYVNFFITIGFGMGVGFMVGLGGELGKIRNMKALVLFGLVAGLFAVYTGWVSWVYAFSSEERLILPPLEMLSFMNEISAFGIWSIFDWTPQGMALYAIWGIEAIMILAITAGLAWGILSTAPFCERCNEWVKVQDNIQHLAPIDQPGALVAQLEQGDLTDLKALTLNDDEAGDHTNIELSRCTSCPQSNFLNIKSVVITKDKKGKDESDESTLIENLILSADDYQSLKQQW